MSIAVEKLEKVYKAKKRPDVHALKGVSFNLPDTGMVFILGKSGCGKSTLLNILGGLDNFDGGDIAVDGKSLKGYKAKELDAYRNAYVGVVFQENNLLEDCTVKVNIALALELQGIKDKDGKVDGVLKSVDLEGYANRKCNRLSGGQKQRVAIARALIKQPKLLLCDEPTGALDSETGEDIFTLLKELSRERLVVVVSHDRESAEKYGYRIIELKDGEIISDSAPQEKTEAVAQEKKKHRGLRFERAFLMGVSYIIARPIRMAICLLLCLITFICVGFADAVTTYDRYETILKAMEDSGVRHYVFGKGVCRDDGTVSVNYFPEMTEAEAEELSSLLDVDRCDSIYYTRRAFNYLNEVWGASSDNFILALFACANRYVETDESFLNDYGFKLLAGALPENNGETALPKFLFDFFKAYGYRNGEGDRIAVNSYEDLIGKTISLHFLDGLNLTVTGIVDTYFNYDNAAKVLYGVTEDYDNYREDMNCAEREAVHNTLFVCKGFKDFLEENFRDQVDYEENVYCVIAPFTGSRARKLKNLHVNTTQYENLPVNTDGGYCYHISYYFVSGIMEAEETVNGINAYSIYAVLFMCAVSVLFITYYASGTISDKKREIGILRALGASGGDVVKVTASEHGAYTAVTVVLASVLSLIPIAVLNGALSRIAKYKAVFISFGIRQFAIIAAVAILAVVVGVALPLIKLIKAKPVDVIADR